MQVDPHVSLVYVSDSEPGIRRRRRGDRFVYLDRTGRELRGERVLDRIRKLAIPPAYTDVWICRRARGHVQATGRDARGRKQYRYHAAWRATRSAGKFARCADFARALPALRRRLRSDLRRNGLPREKVLATAIRVLESTLIRIGNEEYARSNGSFGVTTLRCRHVAINGHRLRFGFRGKGAQRHDIHVNDRSLARMVKRVQELPGQALFQYLDEHARPHPIRSNDVNAYLREAMGEEFTAKDFRTLAATICVAKAYAAGAAADAPPTMGEALAGAARLLGNTPAICRRAYVHPEVLAVFDDPLRAEQLRGAFAQPHARRGLDADESALLRYLERSGRSSKRRK